MRIAQELERLGGRQPAQLVDLVVGHEVGVVHRLHQPVAHHLVASLSVLVARGLELPAEAAAHAGLLLDLAQRAVLPALACIELALRERPVVVARAVSDRDRDRVAGAPPHDTAGRLDLRSFGIEHRGASYDASAAARLKVNGGLGRRRVRDAFLRSWPRNRVPGRTYAPRRLEPNPYPAAVDFRPMRN